MLITGILFLLLSNAVTLRRDKSILYNRIAIVILIYSIIIIINSLYITYLSKGIGLYGGLFHASSITHYFQLLVFVVSFVIFHLTGFYPRKVILPEHSSLLDLLLNNFNYYKTKIVNKMGEQYKILEYPLMLLFIITGAIFLISSSDLISIFISIELQSYGLYLLSTLYRNSELATGAGLTYFLLGGLSSCFILLGIALLYVNSGTTNIDSIYVVTSLTDIINEGHGSFPYLYKSDYINISLLILSIGFLFKISAAPFHFWAPDVYDAIPTIVTTFVAIIAKISILILLLELVHYSSIFLINSKFIWTTGLLISSLLSLIVGTVLGLTEFRIKRLFAYSTISHIGFILLALSINSMESIQSFIFYLIQYSLSNLNAFIILISIGLSLFYYVNNNKEFESLKDKNNSPIQLISQMKGFFYINPVLALSLAITIFSFAGIPPLVGFFAKQMVLSAALDSGYIFLTLIAILTSVISAVYYLNVVKQVFFDEVEYKIDPSIINTKFLGYIKHNSTNKYVVFKYNNITLSSSLTIPISILTLLTLLFFIINDEWLGITNLLTLILFDS